MQGASEHALREVLSHVFWSCFKADLSLLQAIAFLNNCDSSTSIRESVWSEQISRSDPLETLAQSKLGANDLVAVFGLSTTVSVSIDDGASV